MSIPSVQNFDTNQLPVEGTPEFRSNASYVWGLIPTVINSFNIAITWVNAALRDVESDRAEVAQNRNDTLNYKNEATSARDRAESAANYSKQMRDETAGLIELLPDDTNLAYTKASIDGKLNNRDLANFIDFKF